MSPTEQRVLGIFRQFLMTPGQMLCFNSQQLQSYRVAIEKMIEKDLLLKASYKGGYSLTEAGYEMMKELGKASGETSSSTKKTSRPPESTDRMVRKHK